VAKRINKLNLHNIYVKVKTCRVIELKITKNEYFKKQTKKIGTAMLVTKLVSTRFDPTSKF